MRAWGTGCRRKRRLQWPLGSLLADPEETESAFAATGKDPKGKLRVDLQGTLATHFVLPQIDRFFERYPGIELEIGMGDRLVDLVCEGIDCVLRAGEPRESSMVARRVASLRQVTCASSDYLQRHGVPKTLDDLRGRRAVNFLPPAQARSCRSSSWSTDRRAASACRARSA